MPDLLLLDDVAQLEHVLSREPALLKQLHPVTSDLSVATRLEGLGVDFLDLWTLIDGGELAATRSRVHELAAQWWGDERAAIDYRGRCLPAAAVKELLEPFETCLVARTLYERMFDATNPAALHGFFLRPTPMRRSGPTPLSRTSLGMGHTVLRWCAARRTIAIHSRRSPAQLSADYRDGAPTGIVRPPARPDACRAWLVPEAPGYVSWAGRRPELPGRHRSDGRTDRLALLLENVQNPRELEYLEQTLLNRPGWEVLRVIASEQSPCRAWPWHLRPLLTRLRRARAAFEAWCDEYTGPVPEVYANPWFRRQFRSIWVDLERAVGLGESFAHLLELVRPDVAVFGFAAFTLERVLTWVARQSGIPTVGLLHGGLFPRQDPLHMEGDESDLFVWGEADVRRLARPGVQNLHVVGSPRYWQEYRTWNPDRFETPARATEQRAAREALRLPTDRSVVLLITTAISSGFCLVNSDAARHRAAWRDLLALVRRRPDLTFVLKPHPGYDSFAFYRWICRDAPSNLVLLWDASLSAVLPAADVAVLVNCCTTGALEAILAGLPVVFLRAAGYATALHRDSMHDHGAVSVTTVAELEEAVARLLTNPEFRRIVRQDAAELLRLILDAPSPPAPERIVSRLEEIVASSGQERQPLTDWPARYDEVVRLLINDNREAFVTAWRDFVQAMQTNDVSESIIRQFLFCLAVDLGRTLPDAEELLAIVDRCRAGKQSDQEGFRLSACLTSLSWHAYPVDSPAAVLLTAEIVRLRPRALLHWTQGLDALRRARTQPGRSTGEAAIQPDLGARIRRLEHEMATLKGSWTWKMGRLLVGPLARLKRLFRRSA